MKKDQKNIYYAAGETLESIKLLPQLEKYRKEGIDVLLLDKKIDEFSLMMLQDYDKKQFKSISDESLNDEISKQIEIYLPNYASGAIVNCSSENRVLKVSINVDGTVFNFSSGTELDDNEISLNTDLQ